MKRPKPWGGQVVFAVILAVVAIAVFAGFWWERSTERHLRENGVAVMGTVVGFKHMGIKIEDRTYYMRVAYPVKGQTFQSEFRIRRYNPYKRGDQIPLVYDPKNPSTSRRSDDVEGQKSWYLFAFGIALLGGSGALLVWAHRIAQEPPEVPDLDEALSKARRS